MFKSIGLIGKLVCDFFLALNVDSLDRIGEASSFDCWVVCSFEETSENTMPACERGFKYSLLDLDWILGTVVGI